MKIGAWNSRLAARLRLFQSRSVSLALRILPQLTLASEHSRRWTSWLLLISSEKIATGTGSGCSRVPQATLRAMFRQNEVLPVEGRPAMITRSDFWKPR